MPVDLAVTGVVADPRNRHLAVGMDSDQATMNDQKSIFGILVGLVALFALWLWASGNGQQLLAAATGTGTSTTPLAANTTGGNSAPLGGTSSAGSVSTTIAVPQYVSTTAAIVPTNPNAIGGYTYGGATSGGVSITPTVLANSTSVPAVTQVGSIPNWLSGIINSTAATVQNATSLGTSQAAPNSGSFGDYSGPLAANTVGGESAPLG